MSEHENYVDFRNQIQSHRRHLAETLVANQLASDRTVLTLAGGALLLSVTLLVDTFEHPNAVGWLNLAWLLLSISLGSVAGSYWFTTRETRRRIDKIDDWLKLEPNDGEPRDVDHQISEGLNTAGLLALILGLASLAAFAYFNLN